MNDDEFEIFIEYLSYLSDMDLLTIRSLLHESISDKVRFSEYVETDGDFDIEIKTRHFIKYLDIEFSHRNLN